MPTNPANLQQPRSVEEAMRSTISVAIEFLPPSAIRVPMATGAVNADPQLTY